MNNLLGCLSLLSLDFLATCINSIQKWLQLRSFSGTAFIVTIQKQLLLFLRHRVLIESMGAELDQVSAFLVGAQEKEGFCSAVIVNEIECSLIGEAEVARKTIAMHKPRIVKGGYRLRCNQEKSLRLFA